MSKNNLEKLTGLYSLSKTLRFELKPEPATKERFDKWLKEIEEKTKDTDDETFVEYDETNMFGKDVKIANAYKVLKIVLDKLHEIKIEKSLSSDIAKEIDFSSYYESYKAKTLEAKTEEKLRKEIGVAFKEGDKYFPEVIGEKSTFNKKILDYILKDVESEEPMNIYPENISKEEVKEHIKSFQAFFTYLDGYNTNRKNYYEVEKEKSTAIATRIVHKNLPNFCNNINRLEKRKKEYVEIYDWLKKHDKETIVKNAEGKEVEATPITEEIFVIEHFNYCLTQKEIETYNQIIGNYNLLINLYNQNRRGEENFKKLDKFETLHKQIGCGKRKSFITLLQKDKESKLDSKERNSNDIYSVEKLLKTAFEAGKKVFNKSENDYTITLPKFIAFLKDKEKSKNWEGLYWNKKAVENISGRYFANWHAIKDLLENEKTCTSKSKAKDEDPIQLLDAVELSALFRVLDSDELGAKYVFKKYLIEEEKVNVELPVSVNLINLLCAEIEDKTRMFLDKANDVINLKCYKDRNVRDGDDDENVNQVDEWFKYATNSMRIVRYFSVRKNKIKGSLPDVEMENMLDSLLHNDEYDWFGWYNLLRNYLTKKPQDDVKENMLKLNFGKGTLLNGFPDSNTESDNGTQYGGYIFRKIHPCCGEYEYYLGVSKNAKLFRCHLKDEIKEDDKSTYERLDYYQMKSTTPYPTIYSEKKIIIQELVKELTKPQNKEQEKEFKTINKVDNKGNVTPTQLYERLVKSKYFSDILENNNLVSEVDSTIKLIIDNCRKFTKIKLLSELQYEKYIGFKGLKNLINDLKKITSENKLFDFFNVSLKEFEEHNGKDLFLFKISNKDLSYCETFSSAKRRQKTTEKENLHTMFFRSLMREDGYGDIVDIGKGEIFFRKKAFEYDQKTLEKGHHANELNGKFSYPIISKKRFSENKYLLHLSVTLNYKSGNSYVKPDDFNRDVINETLCNNIDSNSFIGIDRGEKHLVYSCIIDNNGRIIKDGCKHYDVINGTNYVAKLEERDKARDKARKSCQRMAKISDLKDGYISHVVHGLTNCVIKDEDGKINPHAYIVLEDLSRAMKNGRQKIEKQVYQKLETALAKKLNFVVDKEAKNGELGSVSKALQLTPPFRTYQDIEGKKQFGVMLYTRANYTSVTDPATGWRKTIYLKDGKIDVIKKQIMDKFIDFGFDGKDYYFKYKENNVGKEWVMYSGKDGKNLPRFQNKKSAQTDYGKWIPEQVDIVGMLNRIFEGFDKTKSFKKQIEEGLEINKVGGRSETSWQSLRYVINVIQQIRNSGSREKDDNFLCSPVRNEKGEHFDTRNHKDDGDLAQIVDADANGAYNIARKGLIMYEHIKWAKEKGEDPNLFVSDKEWDMWLLDRNKWEKYLSDFAKNEK